MRSISSRRAACTLARSELFRACPRCRLFAGGSLRLPACLLQRLLDLAVLVVRAAPQVRDFSFVAVDLRTGGGGLRLAAGGLVRHLELLLRFRELFPRALLAGNALRWRRRLRDGDLRGLDGFAFWRRGQLAGRTRPAADEGAGEQRDDQRRGD